MSNGERRWVEGGRGWEGVGGGGRCGSERSKNFFTRKVGRARKGAGREGLVRGALEQSQIERFEVGGRWKGVGENMGLRDFVWLLEQ